MRVLDETSGVRVPFASPEWVADWWTPPARPEPVDADLAALHLPEPPPVIEVVGRPAAQERATAG
ncbi:MAG TPA: hypothetical protein VFC09_09070 [Candidatus Dormibacteraeota bacterium]|nr:hypothetical protein [Candidatus Dormibacteraeota bacterium]